MQPRFRSSPNARKTCTIQEFLALRLCEDPGSIVTLHVYVVVTHAGFETGPWRGIVADVVNIVVIGRFL